MACYAPNRVWEGPKLANGKINIVWRRKESYRGVEIYLPCYNCVGCREERARQWAVRCMHEVSLHENNCFITLTYDDFNLPAKSELQLGDYQLFMKRLRKQYVPKNPHQAKSEQWQQWQNKNSIRFFHSGEYGDNFSRPHYHALLFNHDFKDKVFLKESKGNKYYTSQVLNELWPYGYHLIGEATFGSANYIARYVHKKATSPKDKEDLSGLKPEYLTMSRRPGIGAGWYEKWKAEVYPSDFIISGGQKAKPPRFYDNILDKENPKLFKSIKRQRKIDGNKMVPLKIKIGNKVKTILVNDNDSFRLPVKEICKKATLALSKNYWRP